MLSQFKSWLGALESQKALEVANGHLEKARKANSETAPTHCEHAEEALSRIKNSVRETLMSSSRAEDRTLCNGIADAYFELGHLLDSLKHGDKAQDSKTKGEKWIRQPQERDQSSYRHGGVESPPVAGPKPSVAGPAADLLADRPLPPLPHLPIEDSPSRDITLIPSHIFAKDMDQPLGIYKLPGSEERVESISQLVYCLDLLRSSQVPDNEFNQTELDWLKVMEYSTYGQERLKTLAVELLREFVREEFKDAKAVAEVVCLVPVLEKDGLQQLLQRLFHGIEQSEMLDFNLLEGLAQLVHHALPGHLNADNLVKILKLISTRLKDTHKQSSDYVYQLTLTVSHVLDAMADTNVKGLDRETLHAPLSAHLHGLEGNTDPHLVYQAAYASQALLYVPDNETPWKTTQRRTGKVVKGVAGLVSAVKALDLNGFVKSLGHIHEGLAGVSQVFTLVKTAYDDVNSLTKSGKQFVDCLKEGLVFSRKHAWYQALRGADILLQNGQLVDFKTLVCKAPCRGDPAFQWGICQRLGELAANAECDDDSRNSAVAFLGEMYQNDAVWGQHAHIKQYILDILMQLAGTSERSVQAAKTLLEELEKNGDAKKQALYRGCREAGPGPYPLKVVLPLLKASSLLNRVQHEIDVEGSLHRLKERRLEGRDEAVYISPQAKANLQARDDALFPLMEKVKEFLDSERKVFLLLGDSGAGKSTFNRELEYDLWKIYKGKEDRIPLFITLAAIPNPEDDLIAKQLRKYGIAEDQIRELKGYRKFILICDGYDESQQVLNLYVSNQLNQEEGWSAQMVISCRSEYLGPDYRDRFQPVDRNRQSNLSLFQEAAIAPFSMDQIQEYVRQFVSAKDLQWQDSDYLEALDRIPGLKGLVANPFLLALSLEVLPRTMNLGKSLPTARVTRVELYDQFVELWLKRGELRLLERKKVSDQEQIALKSLLDEGFTKKGIAFLKHLSAAIYENQTGNSVVDYFSLQDKGTWKDEFFGQESEKNLLREACPLSRTGHQHRFLHRSILEYSLARAVFEPREGRSDELAVKVEQEVLKSPLGRKSYVGEPSVLRFLVERVQQEPVFKEQLLAIIEQSKTEKTELKTVVSQAAANAITILVRAGTQFNGTDLQGIQIPGADLSHGTFESAQLQGADLREVILRNVSLRGADLSSAQMDGVQFGELPFLKLESEVQSGVYSPDGKTFTVGLSRGNISIYATSNWESTMTLSNHSCGARSVAYSLKGDHIASGSRDKIVRLWDIAAGNYRHTMRGHTDEVRSVVYSPKGDQIASGSNDKTVRLWDVRTGDCSHILKGHDDLVSSVVYSPNGDQIASGSNDKTVRLWDIITGDCRHTLTDHSGPVCSVAYSPKGGQIASGSQDKTVRLWDIETGVCRILSGHGDTVSSVAYSPKGDQIASGSLDMTVRLWDIETRECRHTLSGHTKGVQSVMYSPDGDQIASGSMDCTVRLWDVGTRPSHHAFINHNDCVWSVMYSPKGDQIASGSRDMTVRLWDAETGDCRHILRGHSDWVRSVAYSPKGDLIASGSYDNMVRLWDSETGDCRLILKGHTASVRSVAYSPKGDQVASGSWDSSVRLWNVVTGECRHTLTGHNDGVSVVVYSPSGIQIASGSSDRTVRLWDVETGECRHILEGHKDLVSCIVYSPNGDQIASGSDDYTVQIWDVKTGNLCYKLDNEKYRVWSVAYSPNGSQNVSFCFGETVWLWSPAGGHIHRLKGHSKHVSCVAYSPNGDQIASGSLDATVRLWDVASGQCRAVIQNHGPVHSVAWKTVSDGNYLVTGGTDRIIRLWRVMDEGNKWCVRLHWRSLPDELTLKDLSVQDVKELSRLNQQLLKQRGAAEESPRPRQ